MAAEGGDTPLPIHLPPDDVRPRSQPPRAASHVLCETSEPGSCLRYVADTRPPALPWVWTGRAMRKLRCCGVGCPGWRISTTRVFT